MAGLSSFAGNFSHLLLGAVGKVPRVGVVVGGGGRSTLMAGIRIMWCVIGVRGTPVGGVATLRRDFTDLFLWAVGEVAWVGIVSGHVEYLV